MKVFSITWYEKLRKLDYIVLFAAIALATVSLLTLAGSANDYGVKYFYIQLVALVLGVITMTVISTIDYEEIADRFSILLFGVSVFLLVLTLAIGTGDGNKSWIRFPGIPIGIQPSEFVKVMYIITFSKHLQIHSKTINRPKSLLKLGLHAGVIIGLVMLQGDLGSALVFVFLTVAMLFCAGLSIWYLLGGAVVLVAAAPFLWKMLKPYQQLRILAGFWPETDPENKGFQALMSRNAISAGGIGGTGFSGGTEYQKVPFAHTDFIFAITGEKFGFFGAFLVIAFLSVLVIRALVLAYKMRGSYASYMCVGVAAVIIAQSAENIGMCLAKLPVIGITLPFMSYGGSSMLATFCLIGVIQSINAHRGKYFFERQKS
ncbi:MAG: FtsW/RodA/SpoVE family cell cycle protein [Clostridia bacterium]|nr:FtsW/RodA/SpoVE family cell cycle protein [Clostridia bacterium]